MHISAPGAAKRLILLLLPLSVLAGCAVGTYSTYPDQPIYSGYSAVPYAYGTAPVYVAPPLHAAPTIRFGLGIHSWSGPRWHHRGHHGGRHWRHGGHGGGHQWQQGGHGGGGHHWRPGGHGGGHQWHGGRRGHGHQGRHRH